MREAVWVFGMIGGLGENVGKIQVIVFEYKFCRHFGSVLEEKFHFGVVDLNISLRGPDFRINGISGIELVQGEDGHALRIKDGTQGLNVSFGGRVTASVCTDFYSDRGRDPGYTLGVILKKGAPDFAGQAY
jgi:hypothetical protein